MLCLCHCMSLRVPHHHHTTVQLLQLHLYDLVAVRKQQVGTAQALKRTQRTSLKQHAADAAAAAGVCSVCSPAKLIRAHPGKENALAASQLEADPHLLLPRRAPPAKPARKEQLSGPRSGVWGWPGKGTDVSVLLRHWCSSFWRAEGIMKLGCSNICNKSR